MNIKNEDLKLMIEVEELLHQKLEQSNGIKDTHKGEEYYYFDENDKEFNIWTRYNNMIEKIIQQRDTRRKITREYIAEKRKIDKNYARSK